MSPNPSVLAERELCTTTASLLAATAASAGALGLGCSALAALLLLQHAPAPALAAAALMLLPLERVLAMRLRFDAGLFSDLAHAGTAPLLSLDALDRALATLRLRAPAAEPRSLLDRVHGARRLVFWHAATAAAQLAAVLVALALGLRGAA